jgi:hypothetical protein
LILDDDPNTNIAVHQLLKNRKEAQKSAIKKRTKKGMAT